MLRYREFVEDAPVILYYQGYFADLSYSVGIVGARRCNQEVKKQCVQITQSYVRQGILNITVRQSRQSGVARATCPD